MLTKIAKTGNLFRKGRTPALRSWTRPHQVSGWRSERTGTCLMISYVALHHVKLELVRKSAGTSLGGN